MVSLTIIFNKYNCKCHGTFNSDRAFKVLLYAEEHHVRIAASFAFRGSTGPVNTEGTSFPDVKFSWRKSCYVAFSQIQWSLLGDARRTFLCLYRTREFWRFILSPGNRSHLRESLVCRWERKFESGRHVGCTSNTFRMIHRILSIFFMKLTGLCLTYDSRKCCTRNSRLKRFGQFPILKI